MKEQLVSVIIPTYKRPFNMLKRALNSVINQTYKNIEIIVVDDSPNDFSERNKIKNELENMDNVKYIQHDYNMGGCAARNTGIKSSKGDIIAFLDDDDEWINNKIELQMKKISEENADLVYCGWSECIDTDSGVKEKRLHLDSNNLNKGFNELLGTNYIGSTSFVLIKKKCFDACGYFNVSLKSCQDWDMWLRIVKKYKIAYVNEPLVRYHIHNLGRITTNSTKAIQGHEYIFNEYLSYLQENQPMLKKNLYRLSIVYAEAKMYKKSLEMWTKSNGIKPFDFMQSSEALLRIIKGYVC